MAHRVLLEPDGFSPDISQPVESMANVSAPLVPAGGDQLPDVAPKRCEVGTLPYTGPDRVPYFENGTLHHDTLIAHCQSTTLCSVDHCDLVFPLVNGDMLQRSAASCNALSSVQTETRMQMSSVRSEIWRLAILQIRP